MKAPAGKVGRKVAAKEAAKSAPKKAEAAKGASKKAAPKKAAAKHGAAKQGAAEREVVEQGALAFPPRDGVPSDPAVLDRLFAVIVARRTADPAVSHSARLLSRGMPKVAQKFGEEAVECLIEAVAGNRAALVGESADVLYHLMVMWVAAGVEPGEVWAELARREGVSGVAEKAARALPLVGTTKIP